MEKGIPGIHQLILDFFKMLSIKKKYLDFAK